MDQTLALPQAWAMQRTQGAIEWIAHSEQWQDEWQSELEELIGSFGNRPDGIRCPEAIFAYPLTSRKVVCARMADMGAEGEPPVAMAFQWVVLTTREYDEVGGHPFRLFAGSTPPWQVRDRLPLFQAQRLQKLDDMETLAKAYQRPESAFVLGGCQAILDGNRLVVERSEPATSLIADLWTLLPLAERSEHWPASFAFSNALHFDVVVVPKIKEEECDQRYLRFEQAEWYPEGRYEAALQWAIEAGDERMVHHLLLRRTRRQTMKLGLYLLLGMMLLSSVMGLISHFRP